MPDSTPLRTTRRRVLATALATGSVALGTASCDVVAGGARDEPTAPGSSGSASATSGRTPSVEPEADPDEQLVADVAGEVARALAVVVGAGRGRPALARRLREVSRLHRAHLAELPTDVSARRRVRVAGDDAAAARRVRATEADLQRSLAASALAAESGGLAALLGSMSAAVAQRLTTGVLA